MVPLFFHAAGPSFSSPSDCFFPSLPTWTTGPFPVIKQEQLSPHSLSSQADMSSQQASHDGATGRGRWLPASESACVFGVGRYGNQAGLSTVILKMFAFQLGPQ